MKIFIYSLIILATVPAAASDCLNDAKQAALEQASKEYKIRLKNLAAKYITGETLDSDTNSDGSLYITPSYEVFEIRNKKTNRLIVTYSVNLETITDNQTNELVECGVGEIQPYTED
jgi:aspartate/methionine/tyrosine aminotransferase